MLPSTFLNGKVRKEALHVIEGAVPPDAPRLRRLLLPQGELAHFYDGEEGMRYIAFIELRANSIRGNHYHQFKEELVYVALGEILVTVEEVATKERASFSLRAGELAVIATGVAHAYRTVQPGQGIECSPTRFNAADLYRYPLI